VNSTFRISAKIMDSNIAISAKSLESKFRIKPRNSVWSSRISVSRSRIRVFGHLELSFFLELAF
jgi:hypothetical protein